MQSIMKEHYRRLSLHEMFLFLPVLIEKIKHFQKFDNRTLRLFSSNEDELNREIVE